MTVGYMVRPFFGDTEKRILDVEAKELAEQIRLAQELSVTENKRYRLVFDVNAGTYRTQKQSARPNGITWEDTEVFTLSKPVQFGSALSNGNIIEFTNRGTTATPTTILLESSHYFVKLTVNLGAGRVLIEEIQKN